MIVLGASALVDAVLDQSAAGWVLDRIANEEVSRPAHRSSGFTPKDPLAVALRARPSSATGRTP